MSAGYAGLLLSVDDALGTAYSALLPLAIEYRLRGTLYVISSKVGTGSYLTWGEIHEFEDAGWLIANHTSGDDLLTTLTEAEQEAVISACQDALSEHGFDLGAQYLAYPGGANNDDTATAVAATGIRMGRLATSSHHAGLCPVGDTTQVTSQIISTSGASPTDTATAIGYLGTAASDCEYYGPIFHQLDVVNQWTSADFETFLQAWSPIRAQVPDLTIHDLWLMDQGGSIGDYLAYPLQAQVEARGAAYTAPSVATLDGWLTDDNRGVYIGSDGTHPTAAGYTYLGTRLAFQTAAPPTGLVF